MAIDDIGIEPLNVEEIGDSAREALKNSFEKNLSTAQLMYILLHPWDFGDGEGADSTASESYGVEFLSEHPDAPYETWFNEVFQCVVQETDEYIDMGLVAEPRDYENFKNALKDPVKSSIIKDWLKKDPDMGLDVGAYEADKDTALDVFEDDDE